MRRSGAARVWYNGAMRIGIDARMAGETGIGRYVTRLVAELAALDPAHEFVLFTRPSSAGRLEAPGWRQVPADVRWYTLAEQVRMPGIVRAAKLDLFHAPHWNVPLALPAPFVVTVHDLILLTHPSRRATIGGPLRYAVKNAGYRRVLRHALTGSRAVIAVSEATAADIRRHEPAVAAKVTAIPLGGPELAVRRLAAAPPEGRYLLYVGNAYPHKDVEGLLAAVAGLRAMPEMADLRLVWIGQDDFFSQRVRASAAWRALGAAAVFLGSVDDARLAAAYRGAQVLVTASRAEGFGLTPLEALAFGTPVVVSDIPVHREVLGDAALFTPPGDPTAAVAAVAGLLRDPAARARLLAAAPAVCARFSWRRMAEATLRVYESALG